MSESSRVAKSIKNVYMGFASKIVVILMSFVDRILFIKFLGEGLLGINGLFSNVLLILSLADLGMASVMSYSYYEPLAKKDTKKLIALTSFYKKIYNTLAVVITILGLCIIPFLQYIVKLDEPIENLPLIYLFFLANTVISYLFVYKSTVLIADQNGFVASRLQITLDIARNLVQFAAVVITKNILVYLFVRMIFTFLYNYILCKKAEKMYPYVNETGELDNETKHNIFVTIKSGFIYKLSAILLNGTDNILISAIVGTVWVGYIANYDTVITSIMAFVYIIFSSVTASIGNLGVTDTPKRKKEVFDILLFMGFWLGRVIVPCFFFLMSDLLALWIGEKFILSTDIFVAKLIVIYMSCCLNPIFTFRDALGLYKKTKYSIFAASLINVVLSIILGMKFGVTGILLASSIAMLLTYVWYEPVVLYNSYFESKPGEYFIKQLKNIVLLAVTFFICNLIIPKIVADNFVMLFVKAFVCFGLTNLIGLVFTFRTEEFKFYKDKAFAILEKFLGKNRVAQ